MEFLMKECINFLTFFFSMKGSYAVFPFHKETGKYEVYDKSIQVQVVVTHDPSQDILVEAKSSQKGVFHFTASEQGLYLICLYVINFWNLVCNLGIGYRKVDGGTSWFGVRSVRYFFDLIILIFVIESESGYSIWKWRRIRTGFGSFKWCIR